MNKKILISLLLSSPLVADEIAFFKSDKNTNKPITCQEELKRHRVEVRYQTPGGIGYNTGYSTLEAFFTQPIGDSVLFYDGRGHLFDNGKWAANGGFGFRTPVSSIILGANTYYDYREGLHGRYHQVALGLEALKEKWDFRLNGYFPISRTTNKFKDSFLEFKNHRAYFAKQYQLAMTGIDVEFGRYLYQGKHFDLHATLAGYYFNGRFNEKSGGGFLKLSSNISDYFHVDGQVSCDSLFKWLGQGTVGICIPFGKQKKRNSFCSLARRLYEPVSRFEIIVETKHIEKTVARDPVTGDPLSFIFVDNVRGSSNGTYEHPYPTLLEAQNSSSLDNVIYVFAGNGTTKGMNQGIALKNNQQFLGSGVSHLFSTKFGERTIPAQTTYLPHISNTTVGSNTVTMANNNIVSGFNVTAGTDGNGIRATSITNANVNRNVVHGAGTAASQGNANSNDNADIGFVSVNGTILVTGNQTSSSIGIFFTEVDGGVSHIYDAMIANNNHVPNQSFFGIRIWAFNKTQAQFVISGNNIAIDNSPIGIADGFGDGISINPADQSWINVKIQNNTIRNIDQGNTGIFLSVSDTNAANTGPSTLNALIEENLITNFTNFGLFAHAFSVNAPLTLHTLILDARNNTLLNNLSNPAFAGFGGLLVDLGNNSLIRTRLVNNFSTTVANNTFGYQFLVPNAGTGSLLVDAPLGGQLLPNATILQSLIQINPGTDNGSGIVQITGSPTFTSFLPLSDFVLSPYDPSL